MRNLIRGLADRVRSYLAVPVREYLRDNPSPSDAASQLALMMSYRNTMAAGHPLPSLQDVGFKAFSQTDEDGILLYLFSLIGAKHKTCVEICAGDGIECNAANLIINHGWHGLLVDGDPTRVAQGTAFYRTLPNTRVFPPVFVHSWVTRGGVNALLRDHGFNGEIDLLSLDLDGVDYWVWEAIEAITPRVVVVEYQDMLGPERACTVPYADDFSCDKFPKTGGMPNFAGASLKAFVELGRQKGYRLVGVNRYEFNAFFVRIGLGDEVLPEIDPRTCFSHPKVIWGMRERAQTTASLPWVDVVPTSKLATR